MAGPVRGLISAVLPPAGIAAGAAELLSLGLAPPIASDPERDAAIRATVRLVPELGWTVRALRTAAGPDADLMFPGGPVEMVEAHSDLADREMAADAAALAEERRSRRVRALVLNRLARADGERDAVRRGLALLSLPGNRVAALRSLARTADATWNAAGDDATGFSRRSKRAILAGVYGATLLFWVRGAEPEEVAAFLDRRLAGVARLGKLRGRSGG